jgi:hypothetical protein
VVHPSLPKDDQFPHDAIYSPAERNRETVYLEKLMRLLEPYLGNQIEVVNTVSLLHHA